MSHNGNTVDITNGKVIDVEKLAVSANSPEQIPGLLQQVASHGQSYLAEDPQARLKLFEAASALKNAIETPREKIIRHCWAQVCLSSLCQDPTDYLLSQRAMRLSTLQST